MQKLSVFELYTFHRFTPYLIDLYAAVPGNTTNQMIQGIPVSKEHAVRILISISARVQEVFNLDNVTVNLLPEEEEGTP